MTATNDREMNFCDSPKPFYRKRCVFKCQVRNLKVSFYFPVSRFKTRASKCVSRKRSVIRKPEKSLKVFFICSRVGGKLKGKSNDENFHQIFLFQVEALTSSKHSVN